MLTYVLFVVNVGDDYAINSTVTDPEPDKTTIQNGSLQQSLKQTTSPNSGRVFNLEPALLDKLAVFPLTVPSIRQVDSVFDMNSPVIATFEAQVSPFAQNGQIITNQAFSQYQDFTSFKQFQVFSNIVEVRVVDNDVFNPPPEFNIIMNHKLPIPYYSDERYWKIKKTDLEPLAFNFPEIQLPSLKLFSADLENIIVVTPFVFDSDSNGCVKGYFEVYLLTRPLGDVTVNFDAKDLSLDSLSTSFVTFTQQSWAVHKVVTVADGCFVEESENEELNQTKEYKVITEPAISDDFRFKGYDPTDVDIIVKPEKDNTLSQKANVKDESISPDQTGENDAIIIDFLRN